MNAERIETHLEVIVESTRQIVELENIVGCERLRGSAAVRNAKRMLNDLREDTKWRRDELVENGHGDALTERLMVMGISELPV